LAFCIEIGWLASHLYQLASSALHGFRTLEELLPQSLPNVEVANIPLFSIVLSSKKHQF